MKCTTLIAALQLAAAASAAPQRKCNSVPGPGPIRVLAPDEAVDLGAAGFSVETAADSQQWWYA